MIVLFRAIFLVMLFLIISELTKVLIGKKVKKDLIGERQYENKKVSNKDVMVFCGIIVSILLLRYRSIGGIWGLIILLFLVYGMKNIRKNTYKKQVLNDLLNVSECLRVQISSQIPLENALRSLSELCVNKEFAGLLKNLYLEYELSNFIILDSIENLQAKFDYPEIKIFISCLNQQIQGTSAIEALDNLIYILKEKYIEFLEENTKNKMAIMTLGVFGIVLNIAAIGIYPVATEAFNAINTMLK